MVVCAILGLPMTSIPMLPASLSLLTPLGSFETSEAYAGPGLQETYAAPGVSSHSSTAGRLLEC